MSTPKQTPLLRIQGLRTWFRTEQGMVRAVEDVAFEVRAGEAVGVVGESGSGKTQTFFSVFGLSHGRPGVVAGRARFDGTELLSGLNDHVRIDTDATGRPIVRKREHAWARRHRRLLAGILGHDIALIFQEPRRSLIPYWTVGRHLQEVLRRQGEPDSHAGALLSRLGFRHPQRVLQAFPEELSGGEAQRIMLALAVAAKPRILIADEPTTAVDPLSQARILAEIQRIYEESELALVLISHDLAVVSTMVDRVTVMYRGRVVEHCAATVLADGEAAALHPYTAELQGSQQRRSQGLPILPPVDGHGPVATAVGCPYTRQCPLRARLPAELQRRCQMEMPPLAEVGPEHAVACWGMHA
jgi:peptide/nickel transport system ATP-binding protein